MPNSNGYLVAAYVVTWVVLVAYAIRLHLVTRRAEEHYADATRTNDGHRGGSR